MQRMSLLRFLSTASLLLGVTGVEASADAAFVPPFQEIAGELEFSGELIVRPKQSLTKAQRSAALQRIAARVVRHFAATDEFTIAVGLSPERLGPPENRLAQELHSTGLFQYAHPNWIVYPIAIPNDPRLSDQWHHTMMKSREAWDITVGSPAVIVAVTDTGIVAHEDLTNRVGGYNAVSHIAEVDGGDLTDIHGHGTHVAGCAAATGNNGVGVTGMGWSLSVMPIRVSEIASGSASYDALLEGARWAVEHGAKSVSASYSGIGYEAIETTGQYIRSLDASMLWAAGNSSTDHASWDFEHVIVVGASNQSDQRSSFSSFGRGVDLFAPGSGILSSTKDGGYQAWNGTSMATPLANGALGLIRSANTALSAQHAEYLLMHACDPWGGASNTTEYGFGRINQQVAVEQAIAAQTPQPPSARNDLARDVVGATLVLDILANDYDANMDPLVIDWCATQSSLGDAVTVLTGAGEGGRDLVRVTTSLTGPNGSRTIAYRLREPISGLTSEATITVVLESPRAPLNPIGESAGLSCHYYDLPGATVLPDWSLLTPYGEEIVPVVDFPSSSADFAGSGRLDFVGALYEGWLQIPVSGIWTLSIGSDDGSRLSMGGGVLISHDGLHTFTTRSTTLALGAGLHPIRLEFFENAGGAGLTFKWSGPLISTQIIPAQYLWQGGAPSSADLNGDGAVDGIDLSTILSAWGSSTGAADVNGDGLVDGLDLAAILSAWGN